MRYWWPSLLRDVKEAVTTCAHCIILGNNMQHHGGKVYQPILPAEPFNIIGLDTWQPGLTHTSKQRAEMNQDKLGGAILTSLCNTTLFATTAKLTQANSEEVRDKAFQQILVPNGLPVHHNRSRIRIQKDCSWDSAKN